MEELRAMTLLQILALLIVALSMLVDFAGAVDMLFWSRDKCTGIVNPLCDSISEGTCCSSYWPRQSVQVKAMSGCFSSTTYKRGGCNTTVITMSGNACFISGEPTFTGAKWFNNCLRTRRSMLTTDNSKNDCPKDGSNMANNNVIYYRDHPSKGIWTFRRENSTAVELYKLLDSVSDAEKVNWLTSQGATYDFKTEGEQMTYVGS